MALEDWIRSILEAAGERPGPMEFLILGSSALIEYVFPPFPGDAVVLAGAFLVGAKSWSPVGVFVAVNAGGVLGMALCWLFGRWVERHDEVWRERSPRWRRFGAAIDKVTAEFHRRGAIYIAANRFLPALRAAFFIAAGMAALPLWKVLCWGLVSSTLWSLLLFAVGSTVGKEWERMVELSKLYAGVVWGLLAIAALILALRWWRRRRLHST